MSELWRALTLSLNIAAMATLMTALLAVPLAWLMARSRFAGQSLLDGLITVPLVLPPTVVGYFIIVLLGKRGWLGQWVNAWFDYSILFRMEGAVLAAATVSLPLLYLPTKAAFSSIDHELEDIARLYGANRLQVFWHVSIPLARRGILSGLVLAFARALGEFGATAMVFGTQQQTLSMLVFYDNEANNLQRALLVSILLTVISLLMIILYNHVTRPPAK